jgi:hypothetical protein
MFIVVGGDVINIVNLTGCVGRMDDLLSIHELCKCGKKVVSVVPHLAVQPIIDGKMLFNLRLAEELKSQYESLQFIQSDVVEICYVGNMSNDDANLYCNLFGDVRFRCGEVLRVNSKLPVFYKNVHKIPFTALDF